RASPRPVSPSFTLGVPEFAGLSAGAACGVGSVTASGSRTGPRDAGSGAGARRGTQQPMSPPGVWARGATPRERRGVFGSPRSDRPRRHRSVGSRDAHEEWCRFWRRKAGGVSRAWPGTPRVLWRNMRLRTLASLAPLFAAPLAHAQAPGEVQPVVVAPVV